MNADEHEKVIKKVSEGIWWALLASSSASFTCEYLIKTKDYEFYACTTN